MLNSPLEGDKHYREKSKAKEQIILKDIGKIKVGGKQIAILNYML